MCSVSQARFMMARGLVLFLYGIASSRKTKACKDILCSTGLSKCTSFEIGLTYVFVGQEENIILVSFLQYKKHFNFGASTVVIRFTATPR